MRTTISKWGNSLGVRLPRHLAEEAHLVEGATVRLEIEEGAIKITPTRKRLALAELLQGERPGGEVDWGGPVGEEKW